jgi:hypothetical protein
MSAWAFSGGEAQRKPYAMKSYSPSIAKKPVAQAQDSLARGRKLLDAKKYDEAIDILQPIVDENVEARFWLGTAHLAAGHGFRGCRQLDKYVELAPKGRYVKSAKTARLTKC